MDAKEKKRLLEKVEKLKPKPRLLPSGKWRCEVMVNKERISVVDDDPFVAHAEATALKAGVVDKKKRQANMTLTLKEAIEAYIENRSAVLSPATVRGYHVILDNRFPELMKMKVRDIDTEEIQAAVNADSKLVGYKTLKNATALVISAMSRYREFKIKDITFPQKKKTEHAYLDGDQIVKLIFACDGDLAEIPILLGLWLGMRRSEIMGLQWESIDFEKSTIHVDHSLVFDKDDTPIVKNEMKTETSNRVLDCPRYIMQKLEAKQPDPSKRKGTVFRMGINTPYENLERICKREGIPFVGMHGLRHTNASVMLSLGIVDKIAMARGGWATKDVMERVYQHLFSDDKTAADKAINQYFEALMTK
jgi:integrase